MIYVVLHDKGCSGYCTSHEKAIEEVKRDIYSKYDHNLITIETNHNETKFQVYKKYCNMNTYPNDIRGLEASYNIYKAEFIA